MGFSKEIGSQIFPKTKILNQHKIMQKLSGFYLNLFNFICHCCSLLNISLLEARCLVCNNWVGDGYRRVWQQAPFTKSCILWLTCFSSYQYSIVNVSLIPWDRYQSPRRVWLVLTLIMHIFPVKMAWLTREEKPYLSLDGRSVNREMQQSRLNMSFSLHSQVSGNWHHEAKTFWSDFCLFNQMFNSWADIVHVQITKTIFGPTFFFSFYIFIVDLHLLTCCLQFSKTPVCSLIYQGALKGTRDLPV